MYPNNKKVIFCIMIFKILILYTSPLILTVVFLYPFNNLYLMIILILEIFILLYFFRKQKMKYILNTLLVLSRNKPANIKSFSMKGLEKEVKLSLDKNGVPTIEASNSMDVYQVLGFITARDRLFQMDYIRRLTAGNLSEIMGSFTLKQDIEMRNLGLKEVSNQIYNALDQNERDALDSYTRGVNYFQEHHSPGFEFKICNFKPSFWKSTDSVLVFLNMFLSLSSNGEDKRFMKVMEESLPKEVVTFLTQDSDNYSSHVGTEGLREKNTIPLDKIKRIISNVPRKFPNLVPIMTSPIGSNNWAVGGKKTRGDRAILSNDMHLSLTVPNIWYRVRLKYDNKDLNGILIPGTPIITAGSNRFVSWGFTRMCGDNIDLIEVEENEEDENFYNTSSGKKKFNIRTEEIRIKNKKSHVFNVKETIWGPISLDTVMGKKVAIKWTALMSSGVNFKLINMDCVNTVQEGIRVMNSFAGPPMNVVLADKEGNIGWTVCGKIPIRKGYSGISPISWSDGTKCWEGFIPENELPKIINPCKGYVGTANNRMVGKEYPYILGHNYFNSYRSYRIHEYLEQGNDYSEKDMDLLQLDTRTDFYLFYKNLALESLNGKELTGDLINSKKSLNEWDGAANINSKGLSLLIVFHQLLATDLLSPILYKCKDKDDNFMFSWNNYEKPLRQLLKLHNTEILVKDYECWDDFIIEKLNQSALILKKKFKTKNISEIRWGQTNKTFIIHPLALRFQNLWNLLNFKRVKNPGCQNTVFVSWPGFGVSVRFIVEPGKEENGIISIPGGQSSYPLSPNYNDHYAKWTKGESLSFLPGQMIKEIKVKPVNEK